MKETEKLLARIKNLISEDSTILKEYEDKITKTSKDKTKIEEDKKKIETDITEIQKDIDSITKASELTDRFNNVEDYEQGLKKLGNSCDYIKKIQEELARIPEKIEELENKISDLNEKSASSEKAIQADEDELTKLDIELSDAKRYQNNLVELIDLAKSGDINKTREEVVETLKHVEFNEKDALAAAKIVLFPEDDLIPYFNNKNNVVEEVVEEPIEKEEDIAEQQTIIEQNDLDINDSIFDNNLEEENEINLGSTLEDDSDNLLEDSVEESAISFENDNIENIVSNEDTVEETQSIESEYEENETVEEADSILDTLKNNGLDISQFNSDDLELLSNSDKELIENNINFVLSKEIDKDFIYRYPSVLLDNEINDKYTHIIYKLGKTDQDIKLNPLILISYSLADFEKLEEITIKTGIEPKNIPLIVYIKGLQSFLQNYVLLKNNGIDIDDNELSKMALILTIEPNEFKESLDTVLSYGLNLRKGNGKYAIMCLAKGAKSLAMAIDLIIEIGEKDILKYYPEVLNDNVEDLVNRIIFIKKTKIPYKANANGEVVYQTYVLSQEKLDKIVEKKLELHEITEKEESNREISELIKNNEVINYLENMNDNNIVSSINQDEYVKIMKNFKRIEEKDDIYIIGGIVFSKNKVKRNINYLVNNYPELDKNITMLAALFYNSRKSVEEMSKVISTLGIKLG